MPDAHDTAPVHTDRTRDVSVYRLEPGHELESYWAAPDEEAEADYASDTIRGLGDEALLVFGERPPHPRAWVDHVRSLTGLDLDYLTSDASALIIMRTGGETFALTFGSGRWLLRNVSSTASSASTSHSASSMPMPSVRCAGST